MTENPKEIAIYWLSVVNGPLLKKNIGLYRSEPFIIKKEVESVRINESCFFIVNRNKGLLRLKIPYLDERLAY
jgi:hypothetical protein